MKYFFLILFSFVSLRALCQDTSFTVRDFDSAEVYYKTNCIPKLIKEKFTGGFEKFRMSNPGGRFEAGCTGNGPHERLICFVSLKDRYILYYEQGGRAYCMPCHLYEIHGGTIKAVWDIDFGRDRNLTYDALKEMLLKHEYSLRKDE